MIILIPIFDVFRNVFCVSGSGSSAKLYSAPGYLPPEPQRPQTVPCQGNGRVCVPKYQCQGGYVDASQVNGQRGQVISTIFMVYFFVCFWLLMLIIKKRTKSVV